MRMSALNTIFSGAPVSDPAPGRIDAVANGKRGRLDRCRRRPADAPAAIALGTSHAASRRSFLFARRVGPAVEAVPPRLAGFTSSGPDGETVRNFATIVGKCFNR